MFILFHQSYYGSAILIHTNKEWFHKKYSLVHVAWDIWDAIRANFHACQENAEGGENFTVKCKNDRVSKSTARISYE